MGPVPSSLLLATALNSPIEAVDLFPAFLDRLRQRAKAAGLERLILPRQEDFASLPTPEAGYDLVWSEGAAYNLGFERALRDWRRLLAVDGFLALSEAAWLKPPPPAVAAFWKRSYPGMLSRQEAVTLAGDLGLSRARCLALAGGGIGGPTTARCAGERRSWPKGAQPIRRCSA